MSLMDSDGHNTCVSHRSCSRSNPCPLDQDAGFEYWDSIEAIRAAALGVRQKKQKKPKAKSGSKVSGKKSGITVSQEPNLLWLGSPEPVPIGLLFPGSCLCSASPMDHLWLIW